MNARRVSISAAVVFCCFAMIAQGGDSDQKRTPRGEVVERLESIPSIAIPTGSILDKATLQKAREFVTNGTSGFGRLYWMGAETKGETEPRNDGNVYDEKALPRVTFFNLIWPKSNNSPQQIAIDKKAAAVARWRCLAQIRKFVRSQYLTSLDFEDTTAVKAVTVPGRQSWREPAHADKVVVRWRDQHRWFECQDDGIVLTILTTADGLKQEVADSDGARAALLALLNISETDAVRLNISAEAASSFTFGSFVIPEKRLPANAPAAASSASGKERVSVWSKNQAFCRNKTLLFIAISEEDDRMSPLSYPQRF